MERGNWQSRIIIGSSYMFIFPSGTCDSGKNKVDFVEESYYGTCLL